MDSKKVSVLELLAVEPLTGFKILGGWSGKYNIIGEITPTIPDAQNSGDKLLVLNCRSLTTQVIVEILAQAIEKPVAGVFLIGTPEPYLSTELCNAATEAQIPVIYLQALNDTVIIEKTYQAVQRLKEIGVFLNFVQSANSYLINLLNEKGMAALITYLEVIIDNPVIITNPLFEPVNVNDYQPGESVEWKNRLKLLKQHYYNGRIALGKTSDHELRRNIEKVNTGLAGNGETFSFYCVKLKAGNTNHGFLIVEEKQNKLTEFNLAQLNQAAAPIVAELIKTGEVLQTEQKYKESFIYDLLHNNFESHNTIVKQGKIWGWDLAKPHHLLILAIHSRKQSSFEQVVGESLQLIINNVMTSFFQKPVAVELNEQLVLLIPDPAEKNRRERKKYIKSIAKSLKEQIVTRIPEASVSIGIGRYYPSTTELCRSYQEAKTALELGKFTKDRSKVTHFEDLGMMRLLASIRHELLDDFCQEYLDELIAFDKHNKTNLLETLETYFTENGDYKATAGKLFVHANTLRYRLNKIQEVLDVDLQQSEDFLNLLVALKIKAMLTVLAPK